MTRLANDKNPSTTGIEIDVSEIGSFVYPKQPQLISFPETTANSWADVNMTNASNAIRIAASAQISDNKATPKLTMTPANAIDAYCKLGNGNSSYAAIIAANWNGFTK